MRAPLTIFYNSALTGEPADTGIAWVQDADGKTVISTDSGRINQDAAVVAHIVRAVNAHELLIAALRDGVGGLPCVCNSSNGVVCWPCRARSAIKLARGRS